MPTVTTNYFRQLASTSGVNLSGDTYKVALMDGYVSATAEGTLKQVTSWSTVSAYEVSGGLYSAASLTAPTISANTNNVVYWDGSNIVWSSMTLTTYGCAIYRTSDNMVVGFIEFNNAPIQAINGSITIQWNVNGIANIL